MKYISYFFMAIASTFVVVLLSLSSCSPTPQTTTTQPMNMDHSPAMQPQAATHPDQAQPTSSQPANATVKIHNFKFEPANVAIAVGETVQFVNLDEEPHTATSTDGVFNSKGLDTNQTWNYTATKPGTFPYICSIHPFMKGTLTVTPKKK
ncbi:cupredoxin family copper-binding protein [Kovacikia minuta CCNUW1]|uniref:cupredoxin domain-containing protein n=1 Tax=Kovacikia minuta TaxID=2931930 RepID=UPI001CCE1ADA|nr:cupredoxin family copper-binding protein [Kovacikia minuta]UBF27952.1 cupredoxin family copper-binding protein [Kovacikia minuta CCNUW1]